MNEVRSIDGLDAIGELWRRRWALGAAIVLAAGLAFFVSSFLPKTFEAQAIVEVGQSGGKPLESAGLVVRKINIGALACDVSGDRPDPKRWARVSARADPVAEFVQIRLIGTGPTAEEAYARASWGAGCLLARHQALYEITKAQDDRLRATLEFQIANMRTDVEHVSQGLNRLEIGRGNIPEVVQLHALLNGERAYHLKLSNQLAQFDAVHGGDRRTATIVPPSRPSAPIWPRRLLMTMLAGTIALFVGAALFLLVASKPAST